MPSPVTLVDEIVSGSLSLDDAARWVSAHVWNRTPEEDETDFDVAEPGDNEWRTIGDDPRLSSAQYATLANAFAGRGDVTADAFLYDPSQPRARDGRWMKIGESRDLARLSNYEKSRLATLEQLDSVNYRLTEGERREMADLQGKAAGSSRPKPREMTPDETLAAAPLALQRDKRGGTELVCRQPGVALCEDETTSENVLRAAREYRSTSYQDVNSLLREGEAYTVGNDIAAEWVNRLDTAMAASRLTEDVRVTRGLSEIDGLFPTDVSDLTGWTWTERAFVSTTVNPGVAEEIFGEAMVMNIFVPKGTGAIQLSESIENGRMSEGELLLDRNLRMRIIADHGENSRGQRVVDVEVF